MISPTMNSQLLFSSHFRSLLCFSLVILLRIQSSLSDDDPDNTSQSSCDVQFYCGNITVGYPFWGEPGRPQHCAAHQELKLNCYDDDDDGDNLPTMEINGVHYWVLNISLEAQTLRIARKDYDNGICSPEYPNTTINPVLFDYSDGYQNLTFLYDCPSSPVLPVHFACPISNSVKYKDWSITAGASGPGACSASVVVPFPRKLNWTAMNNPSDLGQILKEGFVLTWKFGGVPCQDCTNPEGSCGPDSGSNGTMACPPSSVLPEESPLLPGTHLN
ncbi:hypothetical protein ACOSP7_026198 [Xanthoceras sorbifolium]